MTSKTHAVISHNTDMFIAFGFDHLLFKDSFSFLSSSLEKLIKLNTYIEVDGVDVLIDNWHDHCKLSQTNQHVKNQHELILLTEQGMYPYDYMDNFGRFDECELPPKESFYNERTNTHISE